MLFSTVKQYSEAFRLSSCKQMVNCYEILIRAKYQWNILSKTDRQTHKQTSCQSYTPTHVDKQTEPHIDTQIVTPIDKHLHQFQTDMPKSLMLDKKCWRCQPLCLSGQMSGQWERAYKSRIIAKPRLWSASIQLSLVGYIISVI